MQVCLEVPLLTLQRTITIDVQWHSKSGIKCNKHRIWVNLQLTFRMILPQYQMEKLDLHSIHCNVKKKDWDHLCHSLNLIQIYFVVVDRERLILGLNPRLCHDIDERLWILNDSQWRINH